MPTIYGLTLDHTVNYGSCLQAYALQHVIENMVLSDGTTFDYKLIPIRTMKGRPERTSWQRKVMKPVVWLHHRSYAPFENRYMHYADITNIAELEGLNGTADAFVCGSDVIWNPDFNQNLPAYYLSFAHKYKFSYAASFGKAEIDVSVINRYKDYLASFDRISVRDKTSLALAQKVVDKEINIVCDPVLLMTAPDWQAMMTHPKRKDKYILVYITHLNKDVDRFLRELQEATGLQVVHTANTPKQALKQGILKPHTPQQWLGLLAGAEYVVTNSFHATAFSVMFHRKFFTVVKGDKDKGINFRMYDFLKDMRLDHRMYSSVPNGIDLDGIDFEYADAQIEKQRAYSLDFLRSNLEAAKDAR